MPHKKLLISIVLIFMLVNAGAYAQKTISATGANISGSGGSVSYTIGQIDYKTHLGSGGSVAQGVQHPYEIYVYTSIEQADDINLSLTTYPNPTTDYLTLQINNYDDSELIYQLFDANGKLLQNQKINENITLINMGNLATAIYFLKVFDKNREIKTFKIIKN